MKDYEKIKELLDRKKKLLIELEAVTDSIIGGSVDEISSAMDKRGAIFEKLAAADLKIKGCAENDDALLSALNNTANRDSLGEAEGRIYDAALEMRTVANRIVQNEGAARKQIEAKIEKLKIQIEELNENSSAVADRYQKSVQTGFNRPLGADKNKFI